MSAKQAVMAAIAKTEDQNVKAIMILMLEIMEEIVGKIDALRADEKGLREAVLNGHTACHDEHHEWIAKRIADEAEEAKANAASARKIRDGLLEKVLWLLLVLASGAAGWVLK